MLPSGAIPVPNNLKTPMEIREARQTAREIIEMANRWDRLRAVVDFLERHGDVKDVSVRFVAQGATNYDTTCGEVSDHMFDAWTDGGKEHAIQKFKNEMSYIESKLFG